jgi:hypothetical protein
MRVYVGLINVIFVIYERFFYQDYVDRSGELAAERSQIPTSGYVVNGLWHCTVRYIPN